MMSSKLANKDLDYKLFIDFANSMKDYLVLIKVLYKSDELYKQKRNEIVKLLERLKNRLKIQTLEGYIYG